MKPDKRIKRGLKVVRRGSHIYSAAHDPALQRRTAAFAALKALDTEAVQGRVTFMALRQNG